MPISDIPAQSEMFNEDYDVVGEYRTDDDRIPFYNRPDSGVMYLPGEPIQYNVSGVYYVYMVQGPIRPGKTGYIVRRFTADFPCVLTANVKEGTPIFWNPSNTTASPAGSAQLTGDVTNGFRIGFASYAYNGHTAPTLDGNEVLCGTTASTMIRVVSLDGAAVGKGTLATTAAPTTTTTA